MDTGYMLPIVKPTNLYKEAMSGGSISFYKGRMFTPRHDGGGNFTQGIIRGINTGMRIVKNIGADNIVKGINIVRQGLGGKNKKKALKKGANTMINHVGKKFIHSGIRAYGEVTSGKKNMKKAMKDMVVDVAKDAVQKMIVKKLTGGGLPPAGARTGTNALTPRQKTGRKRKSKEIPFTVKKKKNKKNPDIFDICC